MLKLLSKRNTAATGRFWAEVGKWRRDLRRDAVPVGQDHGQQEQQHGDEAGPAAEQRATVHEDVIGQSLLPPRADKPQVDRDARSANREGRQDLFSARIIVGGRQRGTGDGRDQQGQDAHPQQQQPELFESQAADVVLPADTNECAKPERDTFWVANAARSAG